ncbi:DUF1320 domain-containing protein [Paenochrobactrum glaciei]|uniref:Gp436 family protein n=1 Tax=Paenochrobactrum glaciei TaxID=486407 RepID=A0ABN1FYK1_9HYPH
MIYATKADIEELWGSEFLADILPEDVSPEASVASALDIASKEVDTYLSARYTLPLDKVPAVLKSPTADIAVYKLANRHAALTTTIEDRYKFTIKLLERIADGKAALGADEPRVSSDPSTSIGGAAFSANVRVFSRKTLP